METTSTEDLLQEADEEIKKFEERRESLRLSAGSNRGGSTQVHKTGQGDELVSEQDENEVDSVDKMSSASDSHDVIPESIAAGGDRNSDDMPRIEEAGTGRFVDEALDKQRQSEKTAFQNLIDETVKLENQVNKTQDELKDAINKRDMFYADLEEARSKNSELEQKVMELEYDLKKRKEIEDALVRREGIVDTEMFLERDQLETKLRDAQLRLKRMVKDMEDKDAKIEDLTKDSQSLRHVVGSLEPLVNKDKFDEITSQSASSRDMDMNEYVSPGNVVRGDSNTKSAVCTIQ